VDVVSAGPKPEVGVVCSWFSTNQNLYRRTPNNLLLPLSRLAWPVNREVQCIIIEITALYRITAPYCTSLLTGNARRDNGTRCQDRLPPPRIVGGGRGHIATHTANNAHPATITISQQNRHSKQLIMTRYCTPDTMVEMDCKSRS